MPIIKKHQTLIDCATQTSGDAVALVQLAFINGLSITDDAAGSVVTAGVVNEAVTAFYKLPGNEIACLQKRDFRLIAGNGLTVRTTGQQPIKVRDMQTWADAALFIAGDATGFMQLVLANNASVTDDFYNGQIVEGIGVVNKDVVKAFKISRPATAIIPNTPAVHLEGIDYWAIELDFVVS